MLSTRHLAISAVVAVGLVGSAGAAAAQTTVGNATGTNSACYYAPSGAGNNGQTFTVPAGVVSIRSLSIAIAKEAGPASSDYRLGLRSTPGSPELAGVTGSTTESYPTSVLKTYTIPGGYPVTPGAIYFLSVDSVTPTIVSCGNVANYAGGNFVSGNPLVNQDAPFLVVFNDAPPPTPVPTLSQWALILFGLLIAGGAALQAQRRLTVQVGTPSRGARARF